MQPYVAGIPTNISRSYFKDQRLKIELQRSRITHKASGAGAYIGDSRRSRTCRRPPSGTSRSLPANITIIEKKKDGIKTSCAMLSRNPYPLTYVLTYGNILVSATPQLTKPIFVFDISF